MCGQQNMKKKKTNKKRLVFLVRSRVPTSSSLEWSKKLNLKECGFIFVRQLFASADLKREHSEVLPFNLGRSAKRIFFSTARFLKNSR